MPGMQVKVMICFENHTFTCITDPGMALMQAKVMFFCHDSGAISVGL